MAETKQRFRSRYDGHRMRIPVHTCLQCLTQHTDGKPRRCRCGSNEFQYFPSKTEANRYPALIQEQRYGLITKLECQPSFQCVVNGVHIVTVRGDFSYYRDGQWIVEDVKAKNAPITREFKIGRKLVGALFGVEIQVVPV